MRLAQAPPGDLTQLAPIPGCTPKVIARWGEAILSAVARALALPETSLPTLERRPRLRLPAVVAHRIEALRQWRKDAAPRFGLEPGLLLPNRLITAVAMAGPREPHALAGAYNNRANDKILTRDFDGAMVDCNKSIALDPASPLPFYNRGYVFSNQGNYKRAIADWEKAIQMQPSFRAELEPQIARIRQYLRFD